MKITRTRIFKASVDVEIPDGEGVRTEAFIGHFMALASDELATWPGVSLEEQDQNLRRVLVGWDGLKDDLTAVGAKGDDDLPDFAYSAENRDLLIRDLFIRRALLRTYAVSLSGAKRGN